MNAKELIDKLSANPTSPLDLAATSAAALPIILRALRLLAAAEGEEGTPETDACADWNARCERIGDNEIITHGLMLALAHDEGDELRLLARRLERERNGLSARVRELEEERCCTCRDGALKQPYSTMPPLQTLPWGTEK